MLPVLQKKLKLPWTSNYTEAVGLYGDGVTAIVTPILQAAANGGVSWQTQVTVSSTGFLTLNAMYGGCFTEYGQRLVETFLFDAAIGNLHLQKELRRLMKKNKERVVQESKPHTRTGSTRPKKERNK